MELHACDTVGGRNGCRRCSGQNGCDSFGIHCKHACFHARAKLVLAPSSTLNHISPNLKRSSKSVDGDFKVLPQSGGGRNFQRHSGILIFACVFEAKGGHDFEVQKGQGGEQGAGAAPLGYAE